MQGKVGIIGAGLVGAAAGYLLANVPGVSEVVLVDLDRARAESEAADISHAAAFGSPALVRAGDYADLDGSQVVVITAGTSLKPGQTRLDLLAANIGIISSVLERVLEVVPDTVLLFATNPVDVMPAVAVRRFGVPRGRAIGTGCALDSARFRDRLARHLGVSPSSVHAYVLGEHGDSEVIHWSGAQIAGMPLTDFAEKMGNPLPPELRETIAREVRTSAYRIKEGKGVSNFGIGGCIARLTRAIVNDEHVVFSTCTVMDEVLGVPDTCISLPHVLSSEGASHPFLPRLDGTEEAALRHSAEVLRKAIQDGLDATIQ
ncbi:lactate/malate family dehydrogenase [Roseomonas marmotae]|uniref:L-lactate dehydrogenase n=1 Tax=Roseomonas marmotae TaxID=2768161 RepID=A0ABS3KB46_9PROT|nr:L-lactate dehydrogenase [Roseomonas marmotae]MBO1074681.1 L-lactate dehydrogenase [Roseomonas marmotae]QTI81700.1 L-lactate dehydrogenase [Roseomonas marmotae]